MGFFLLSDKESTVLSRFEGCTAIDHVEILGLFLTEVCSSGQLPMGIGYDSNYCGLFVDTILQGLIKLIPDTSVKGPDRILKSGNKRGEDIHKKSQGKSTSLKCLQPSRDSHQ